MKRLVELRPRRIALVTHGFEIGGGVPTATRWLRDGLRSVGYAVDVHDLATSSRDQYSRRLLAPKSWVRSTLRHCSGTVDPVVHWGANVVEIEAMRYRPRRELKKALQTYDLVQVWAGSPAWGLAVIGTGIPVVLKVATRVAWERQALLVQQTGPMRVWRKSMTLLTDRLERRALAEAEVVLVENSAMLAHVRSTGQERVINAPPGVDTKVFCRPAAGWRRRGYLLSVCRLNDARKGLDRMVRAYAQMLRIDDSTPALVLAGRGNPTSALVGLVTKLGLSARVAFRSDVDRGELPDLYGGASVFLQASHEEGYGVSVLEAMACGLPVVCTDTAGTRETVLDGLTGWLVRQDSESQVESCLADRAVEVLRGDGSAMGSRGRERCETNFSSEVALRRFTDVYDDLLNGGASALD